MKQASQAVAAEVLYDRHAIQPGNFGDRAANVAKALAGADLRDAGHERIIGHIHQALGLPLHIADAIHARMVAMPAINDQGDVDIGDIAFLQRLGAGDTVTDDMVE